MGPAWKGVRSRLALIELRKGGAAGPAMQRFVLTENIQRYRKRLAETVDGPSRTTLQGLVAAAERELALLDAAEAGVLGRWERISPQARKAAEARALDWFRQTYGEAPALAALIDPKPGLPLVDFNVSYAIATGVIWEEVAGKPLFEIFPENPAEPAADGVANLYASLRKVAESGREHAMPLQRYDTQSADGEWVERWWRPVNRPVLDDGELIFLLNLVEDATEEVLSGRSV